jgi:hypothetical protein
MENYGDAVIYLPADIAMHLKIRLDIFIYYCSMWQGYDGLAK